MPADRRQPAVWTAGVPHRRYGACPGCTGSRFGCCYAVAAHHEDPETLGATRAACYGPHSWSARSPAKTIFRNGERNIQQFPHPLVRAVVESSGSATTAPTGSTLTRPTSPTATAPIGSIAIRPTSSTLSNRPRVSYRCKLHGSGYSTSRAIANENLSLCSSDVSTSLSSSSMRSLARSAGVHTAQS